MNLRSAEHACLTRVVGQRQINFDLAGIFVDVGHDTIDVVRQVDDDRRAKHRVDNLDGLAADLQESVNEAVESLSNTMDYEMPSLEKVEEKIEKRKSEAMAKAELRDATPQGAEAELKEAIGMVQAEAKLDELKAELGLST